MSRSERIVTSGLALLAALSCALIYLLTLQHPGATSPTSIAKLPPDIPLGVTAVARSIRPSGGIAATGVACNVFGAVSCWSLTQDFSKVRTEMLSSLGSMSGEQPVLEPAGTALVPGAEPSRMHVDLSGHRIQVDVTAQVAGTGHNARATGTLFVVVEIDPS